MIEVIGAGLGRTGTRSLKEALEQLGFSRCYHMEEVILNLTAAPVWSAAGRGESVDWEALFQGYRATVDWPACSVYRELMQRYPEAKVILTVRNAERWYESAQQTIYYARSAFPRWPTLFLPRMRRFVRMVDDVVWQGFFQGKFEDKDYAIAAFHRHNEEVRRTVPPERLLVYNVKEGWGPLCAFLNVPVPGDRPFPHLNDTEEFRTRIRRSALILRGISYVPLAVIAGGMAWLVHWWLS